MGVEVGPVISSKPTILTVTLTDADTEYSVDLPDGTRRFTMQPRSNDDVRFAFESGKVATPTEPYATMKAGAPYTEEGDMCLHNFTVYLASSVAGVQVEIVCWS